MSLESVIAVHKSVIKELSADINFIGANFTDITDDNPFNDFTKLFADPTHLNYFKTLLMKLRTNCFRYPAGGSSGRLIWNTRTKSYLTGQELLPALQEWKTRYSAIYCKPYTLASDILTPDMFFQMLDKDQKVNFQLNDHSVLDSTDGKIHHLKEDPITNQVCYSGFSQPAWPAQIGSTCTGNNGMIWACEEFSGSDPVKNDPRWWQYGTMYKLGDVVIPRSDVKTYQYRFTSLPSSVRAIAEGTVNLDRVRLAAQIAAEQVQYIEENYPGKVKYYEMGNEPYNRSDSYSSCYNGTEYAQVLSIMIPAMIAVVPNIKILVCATMQGAFTEEMISSPYFWQIEKYIYGFAVHEYYTASRSSNKSSVNYGNVAISDQNLENGVDFNSFSNIRDLLAKYGIKNPKFIMNEFNLGFTQAVTTNPVTDPNMPSYATAVCNAREIIWAANQPDIEHIDVWRLLEKNNNDNDFYSGKGYGIVHYAQNLRDYPFVLSPTCYVIKMLNQVIRGKILSYSNNNPYLKIAVSQTGQYINVIIMCLNLDNQITIDLSELGDYSFEYVRQFGKGVNLDFTAIPIGDRSKNPKLIRKLPINIAKVNQQAELYNVSLLANTLSVLMFKKI